MASASLNIRQQQQILGWIMKLAFGWNLKSARNRQTKFYGRNSQRRGALIKLSE